MLCDAEKCTGCGACYNACPQNCIEMELSERGYLLPSIGSGCTGCKACERACPIINDVKRDNQVFPTVYLAHSRDENILRNAASGGIATIINKHYIQKLNGYACGIKFSDDFLAVFDMAGSLDELNALSHSKYVQSSIGDGYRKIKEKLDQNEKVFFCGLPCQVAGLYSYLGREYENLLTADIVCHGTSSSKVFQNYIKYTEEKLGKRIKSICQTNKKYGWNILIQKLVCIETMDGQKYYYDSKKDSYLHMFLENMMLKPSCQSCKYQVMPRIGDLTLGDFFGIGAVHPVKNLNPNGESMVMVNTVKGKQAFESIREDIYCEQRELEEAMYFNHNLWRSSKPHKRYKEFQQDMTSLTYKELSEKYYSSSVLSNVNRVARNIIKKIFGLKFVAKGILFVHRRNGAVRKVDDIIAEMKTSVTDV